LRRIRQWVEHWDDAVYVSFSGGKDSTVLLHLVRSVYPDVPAVFLDTGLEYPEVRTFVRTVENVTWLKPKIPFAQVIEQYGYPVVSKEVSHKIREIRDTKSEKLRNKRLHGDDKGNGKLPNKWRYLVDAPFLISEQCCDVLKKRPLAKYEHESGHKPLVGTMAVDSRLRRSSYLQHGCNSFANTRPMSTPLAFWTEQDIWHYLRMNQVPYSSVYDLGYERTGCMFCCFGVHLQQEPNRFQVMQWQNPQRYRYCMEHLGLAKVLSFLHVPTTLPSKQCRLFDNVLDTVKPPWYR